MHTILIDIAAVTGPAWDAALRRGVLPRLSRALRLADLVAEEAPRADAEAAWLSPAERWLGAELGLGDAPRAPWGALAALAEGLSEADSAWALALPVHLELGRESLSLDDPQGLQLAADEAAALLDAVRGLLGDDGWRIEQPQPGSWLLAHPSLGEVDTADPARAIGRNVASWMPGGDAARPWRRLLTEIQMVWQHHDINEARIARGAADVNTLWLHGCGRLPRTLRGAFAVDAREAHTAWALAAAGGLNAWPATAEREPLRLLQPDATRLAAEFGDVLAELDASAAQAVDEALGADACARVVLAGERRWIAFDLRQARRWRFWRRADADALLRLV
jgi:hypothetical protein